LLSREQRSALFGARAASTSATLSVVREAMRQHAQAARAQSAESALRCAMRAVAHVSVALSDAERAQHVEQVHAATDALFDAVDACFDARGRLLTLGGETTHWRTLECAALARSDAQRLESRGWCAEARRFFAECGVRTALVADLAPHSAWRTRRAQRDELCEAVWRAALPFFGADAPFSVFARCSTTHVLSVAIVARQVRSEYAEALYDAVRVERDVLALEPAAADATPLPPLRRAVLDAAQHWRSESVVSAVRSVETTDAGEVAQKVERALLENKQVTRGNAHARHLYKNIVATSVLDFTLCFSIVYEPIVERAPHAYAVRFSEDEALRANDSERLLCEMHYDAHCFDEPDAIGCRRAECVARRHERGASARVGCLGSWVLALRIDPNWFVRNDILPSALEASLARALGPSYHVLVGDMNSESYVALRVRVLTCCVRDELHVLNTADLRDLDNFAPHDVANAAGDVGADDDDDDDAAPPPLDERGVPLVAHNPQASDVENAALQRRTRRFMTRRVRNDELTVLDRVKWLVLHHRACGPSSGSVVMGVRERQAVFTDERGLEHVRRNVIVSDSSDLYHLLALRGVDTRRVRTNSLHDVCDVFGIEACRDALVAEYDDMMAAGGSFVNRAHYALRADMQTRYGAFHALTINGLLAAPHDPIQAASHCRTANLFFDAALKKRGAAQLSSPSASVALGQPLVHQGTGAIDVLMDVDALTDPARYRFEQPEPSVVIGAMQERAANDMSDRLAWLASKGWGADVQSPEHHTFADSDSESDDEARAHCAHALWERANGDEPTARFSPVASEDGSAASVSSEEDDNEDEAHARALNDAAVLQMHTDETAEQVGPSSEFINAFDEMSVRARDELVARVKRARAAPQPAEYDPVEETQRVALRSEIGSIARSALEYDPAQPALEPSGALHAVQAASLDALSALAQKVSEARNDAGQDDESGSSLKSDDFSSDFMGTDTTFGLF